MRIAVIIDAFRAFATAGYILERQPHRYYYTSRCEVVSHLQKEWKNSLLIGKPQKGSSVRYNIPNSPKRTFQEQIKGRTIIHRTEAGSKGILAAKDADLIFAVGFGSAKATANHLQSFSNHELTVFPMGHEGETPSLEDNLCASYFFACLRGESMDLSSQLFALKNGPGRYFFEEDQWQYPKEDFAFCMECNRFNFVIEAEVQEGYAILTRKIVQPLVEAHT